jgi:hypothetical protein
MLSIFSFEKRGPSDRPKGEASRKEAEKAPASVAVAECEEMEAPDAPRTMVLDLEHLTPETLAAFFPSEKTLPKQTPRRSFR